LFPSIFYAFRFEISYIIGESTTTTTSSSEEGGASSYQISNSEGVQSDLNYLMEGLLNFFLIFLFLTPTNQSTNTLSLSSFS